MGLLEHSGLESPVFPAKFLIALVFILEYLEIQTNTGTASEGIVIRLNLSWPTHRRLYEYVFIS